MVTNRLLHSKHILIFRVRVRVRVGVTTSKGESLDLIAHLGSLLEHKHIQQQLSGGGVGLRMTGLALWFFAVRVS